MAASSNLDNLGTQLIRVPDWRLGINTASPPTEIQDAEVQDLLNFEFDDNGNISTRRGVTELFATTFANRITSLHYFSVESGEIGVLYTTGTQVRIVETDGSGDTNLTGALTLPSNTFWQWVTFDGMAIGVNKATSGDNPIKVSDASVATALTGTPPKGKYIDVWNNRVWIVSATEPNQLWGSKLGDPENWTDTTAAGRVTLDIDPDDGDIITGLFATRDALYIFKRRSIHRLIPYALPETDPANLKREVLTRNIGCASPYSIRQVVDDVLFLSDQGIASLSLVVTAENFRTAFYSRNVAELERFNKTTEEIPAFLFDTAAQYWISLPSTVAPTGDNTAYVLDYLRLNEQIVRWTRFDNMVAGTAFTSVPTATGKLYLIAAPNSAGTHQIWKYRPRVITEPFTDDGEAYAKTMKMKSFNADIQLIRKFWHEWGLSVDLMTATAGISIGYYFDQNPLRGDSYSFGLQGVETGALWGAGLWAAGLWGSQFSGAFDIVRELKSNNFGRESQDITFTITNAGAGEGFTLQDWQIWYSPLNQRKVTDV